MVAVQGRVLAQALLAIVLAAVAYSSPARAETATAFMQRASNDLVAANRARSPVAFASTLRKYGDLPGIGLTSLGTYAVSLPKSDRPLYFNGIVNFISRYAANESTKYIVDRAAILGQSEEDANGASVETRIWLRSGESYDVRWKLIRSGASFKIRDAQVLGFWMTPFLADLFQKYIGENGGSSKALILALNRYGGNTPGTAEASAR
ncbi:MAG: ABC transporter substrate-binding protein [Hyphomicrobiaceae bacterium]|nr:ABC transporter substrate-binding protein [Hyphomicrobiaceae bacterium]